MTALAGALQQRARLLDAVWADVQGDQRAVRRNALPARLLPAVAAGCAPLGSYAADLIACSDGVWRVVRDDVGPHPGAGLLEMPLLAAFLPGLSRLLLGEALRLASVPVWWLGEPEIRPIWSMQCRRVWIRDGLDARSIPVRLAGLPADARMQLQAAVAAEPDRFIAGLDIGSAAAVRHVTCDTREL